ncbi:MAG: homoserine O-acetyltransferase [Candidatus Melainabacteria bacterium GWF2_32_7]|nr:MAG: homoserine O-acetyltransferase [Candidatus Melainabacteria bacterium GWF2_32_7]
MTTSQELNNLDNSVGIVETKYYSFSEKIKLENGLDFGPITVAYETYGKLNENKDNAILVLHALSGDAHAAGYHSQEDKKPGWWDDMIGPGRAFDTNKYFVISSNILGGCKGTTGPASINPETQKPYALTFPMITVEDMVKVQKKLIDYLGIQSLLSVTGGSMGGMQAMEWAINYPEMVKSVIVIASTSRLSAQGIAFNQVGRSAIISDPNWNNGNYYDSEAPAMGLAIARMIGHITYLSEESMHQKFGRKLQNKTELDFSFDINFQVESYLRYQGKSFVDRFDANSYLYITKAMDYFDIPQKYGSLTKAFKQIGAKFLVISFSSDWLFPPEQSKDIVKTLMKIDKEVTYCDIESPYGHDAFLLEYKQQAKMVKGFLKSVTDKLYN